MQKLINMFTNALSMTRLIELVSVDDLFVELFEPELGNSGSPFKARSPKKPLRRMKPLTLSGNSEGIKSPKELFDHLKRFR